MAEIEKVEGVTRKCRLCLEIFQLCLSCDSGYYYCSDNCKSIARKTSLKAANKKYRKTYLGRKKHKKAQVKYRANLKFKKNQDRTLFL